MSTEYFLVHSVAVDFNSSRGIAWVFRELFGDREEVMSHQPTMARVLELTKYRKIFCLVMIERIDQLPIFN